MAAKMFIVSEHKSNTYLLEVDHLEIFTKSGRVQDIAQNDYVPEASQKFIWSALSTHDRRITIMRVFLSPQNIIIIRIIIRTNV